ncbi:MAG: N-acetylmuramoyl-L-alanine amidase [Bacteroidales bacterium]
MGSDFKNVKERTNNIKAARLISMILLAVMLPFLLSPVSGSERKWVVVIDPGHGGKDPGALGAMSKEKNINLAIALKAGNYIEQNLRNVEVLYTRKTDVFPGLYERAEFANKNKADLFISIHANAISKKTIKGTETWIMGLAKDDQNLEVAMKENEVILLEDDFSTKYEGFDPKSPESYIMFTIMQNTYREQSLFLATNIQNQFRNRAGRIDLGVKQAGFLVLYMTSMPSVLIETGFLTNLEEEKYLNSKEGQDYLASAIYRAVRDYVNEIDKKTNTSSSARETIASVQSSSTPEGGLQEDQTMFMVQIVTSASRKQLTPDNFSGLQDVVEIESDNQFKYAAGSFENYSLAAEYRKKIESLYPDAFIIAVRNNKILPLQEALNPK